MVVAGNGRAVVDAIIDAGPEAETQILTVSIRGGGDWEQTPAAQSMELPMMQPLPAARMVVAGQSAGLVFPQGANTVFMAHASEDLENWQPLMQRYLDGGSGVETSIVMDDAVLPRRFYLPSLAVYPAGSPGVTSLADATLEIAGDGFGMMRYHFDSTGMSGTYENIVSLSPPPLVFSGHFVVADEGGPRAMPNSFQLRISTPGLGGAEYQFIRVGWDDEGAQGPTGRHVVDFMDASMGLIFQDAGAAELSRN